MKKIILSFLILFCFLKIIFSDAVIGKVKVLTDVRLTSKINKGEKGILIILENIILKDYKDRLVTFSVVAYKDSPDKMPVDYMNFQIKNAAQTWKNLSFEITNVELQNYLGKGKHKFYIIFNMHTVINDEIINIPGSNYTKEVEAVLDISNIIDKHEKDKKTNHDFIKHKAVTNPVYQSLLELAEKYDLIICFREFTISSKGTKELYKWDFLTEEDDEIINDYAEYLVNGWNKLPVDFVNKTGLRALVFVKNIHYAGLKVGGGFDTSDKFIICDTGKNYDKDSMMHVILHEYMHLIDNIMYTSGIFDTKKWSSLNPSGTEYKKSGALDMIEHDIKFVFKEHPQKGFLNGYCLADIYQDKAEVFSYLLIPSYYNKVEKWFKEDKYLKAKFQFMENALYKISPNFSKEFFRSLHE